MENRTYRYRVTGFGANDVPWEVTGFVDVPPGEFWNKVFQVAGAETFHKLTGGECCQGPHRIISLNVVTVAKE